jgi:hypothetical protein
MRRQRLRRTRDIEKTELKMDAPNEPAAMAEIPTSYPTNRQRRILWNGLTAVAAMSLLGAAALTFYGFIPILLPIGLAVIIALILQPVVDFVQKRGLGREAATLMVCILAGIGFMLFWAFLVPPLVAQAGSFFRSLPGIMSNGVATLDASLTTPTPKSPLQLRPTTPQPLFPEATNQLAIAEPMPPAPKMFIIFYRTRTALRITGMSSCRCANPNCARKSSRC